jgi:hypothetical protein
MPKNWPINIVFDLFWVSSSSEPLDPVSYMNVVYTMTLATKIDVVIDFGGSRVIDVGRGEDLSINAICSGFFNSDSGACDSSVGLSFKWECATYGEYLYPEIAEYCRQWNGSPVIVIPNELIKANNALNK